MGKFNDYLERARVIEEEDTTRQIEFTMELDGEGKPTGAAMVKFAGEKDFVKLSEMAAAAKAATALKDGGKGTDESQKAAGKMAIVLAALGVTTEADAEAEIARMYAGKDNVPDIVFSTASQKAIRKNPDTPGQKGTEPSPTQKATSAAKVAEGGKKLKEMEKNS